MRYNLENDDPGRSRRGGNVRHLPGRDFDMAAGRYEFDRYPEYGFERGADEDGEGGFQFWDAVKVVSRWRWLIVACALLAAVAAATVILRATPLYQASATIEVQPQETQIMEGLSIEPTSTADAEFMSTQYTLLKSRSLAERVAENLNLAADARYADQSAPIDKRLAAAAGKVRENLSVSIVGRSRIIEIRFVSPHRNEAARVANGIAEGFIESSLERKYNATAYARNFVGERLLAARTALEQSEAKLVRYAGEKGILDLGGEGKSAVDGSLDATSLTALNAQLSEAQSRRIALEVMLEGLRRGEQRQALESDLLRELARRRSEAVTEYNEKLNTFQPDFPEMTSLRSQIEAIDREIAAERSRIIAGVSADYRAAKETEASIRSRIKELKGSLQDLRNKSIDYGILSRDVDTNRAQYEALLQRMKEISIVDGVGKSRVSIVDKALAPNAPFEPNKKRILIQFLILGLAAGVGLAFALEYIDDTIKSPEDLPSKLDIPAVGVLPLVKSKDPVTAVINDPGAPISEAVASARMALQFATPDGAPESLLVTSIRASEGKTNTCASLGVAFARIGKRVLIIDADMRKPSFAARKGASTGVAGMLTQDRDLAPEVVGGAVPNLFLLPCTTAPVNPAELLAGPRLADLLRQAREQFDLVIVDSPPVLGFADAPTLSAVCDATLVVFQAGAIRRPAAKRAIERLHAANARIVGGMVTKFKPPRYGYGANYAAHYAYGDKAAPGKGRKKGKARRKVRIFSQPRSKPKEAS